MAQIHDTIQIESSFQYTGSTYDDLTELQRNILEYQSVFSSLTWTKEELENIAKQRFC